jgi:hypothetical protein
MPHLLAIILCLLLLFAAVVLVRMEFKRSRKGPQLASADFLRGTEELHRQSATKDQPAKDMRKIQHEW